MKNAAEVALSLLEMGIDAMKIWPFDYAAERSRGQYISTADLKKALEPFEKIAVLSATRWRSWRSCTACGTVRLATRIARALEPFDPLWVEDPVMMDHMDAIGEVARSTRAPIAVGETRGWPPTTSTSST
jgi:L-alanine-DL-glutamate epimerase-like enolase superfamily enzyme